MLNLFKRNGKFKAKIHLAFFILYNFDPDLFHTLKSFQHTNKKNNKHLLENLENFKSVSKKFSQRFFYRRKFIDGDESLKFKYFARSNSLIKHLRTSNLSKNIISNLDLLDLTESYFELEDFLTRKNKI